jgi:glycosyltransferase involved in cell wall biosynthesis
LRFCENVRGTLDDQGTVTGRDPLVSVCMPTYNAEGWIREAIDSALEQTWTDFEIVISDNASTDATLEIARSYADPRIRIESSARNMGLVFNHNRVVRVSAGRYIKFLHADDVLTPTCIEEMVGLALEDDRIGLVFAPRVNVIYDEHGHEWARMTTRDHEKLGPPDRNNDGHVLFLPLLLAGIEHNWIGEPSAVLVTREALETCGLFNRYLRQIVDLELWLRVMLRYRVGFLDTPMCLYRMHQASVTAHNHERNRDWLDRVWLFESLLYEDDLGPFRSIVFHLRRKAIRQAVRTQVRRVAKRQFTPELMDYFRFRSLPAETRRARLRDGLDSTAVPAIR